MSDKAEQNGAGPLNTVKWLLASALIVVAIWGNGFYGDEPLLYRAIGVVLVLAVAALFALQTEQGRSFNQLRKDAFVEMRKVVWPTRQETVQTTLIVLVFVVIVALILFFFDWVLNGLVSWIIG